MSQFTLLGRRRFAPFFWTQALGAFNDNAFRSAMVALVSYRMALPQSDVSLYNNLAPGLFILPYFLFSASAGQLAERFEKTRIIRYVKLFEILAMMLAAYGFITHHLLLLLCVLFMMGMHSTVFGPIKYAILPQALKPFELVGGNGLVEMGTQMAILIGLIAGVQVMQIADGGSHYSAAMTIGIAIVGYFASRLIPAAPATAPDLKLNWNPVSETMRVLRITRESHAVFNAILGISWYWFFGTLVLAHLPMYASIDLGGDASVYTTVLVLFSVGTGIGALMCEKMSGRRVEIGLVPLGAFGLTVFALDLYLRGPVAAGVHGRNWSAFLLAAGSWRIVLDLTLIGVFSGFYVVPLFAFVQARTKADRLSRVIAGNNILNALFIVTASLFGLVLDRVGLSVPQVFLVAAVLNVVVAVYIFTLVPEFLMRFITWILVNTLYRIRVEGMKHLPEEGAALLVCNHVSFMDPLILMASLRRPARFVMYYKIFKIPLLHFVFKTAKAIPIAGQKEDPAVLQRAFEDIDEALANGELVCIFPEGGLTRDGQLAPFRAGVEKILQRRPVPVVPMALRGLWGSVWSRRDSMLGRARLPRRFRARIELVVDAAAPAAQMDAAVLQDRVQALRGDLA
ncbi:MFS transporter [Dyella mobilis]|uniref:MFS transporter n=1 Tax=Dyella mobilis TaxID=1849582 RepID=A0ABS2KES6_9GAMM|nr:MFS transporter [Dyella mobilis]MBM7129418.1 MFS transporter [Dyella mobilis]GLQ98317.1 MFS transporter [Dyella mobilis]